MDEEKKSSFEKLVAGLTAEDRKAMLQRISRASRQAVQILEPEIKPAEYSMKLSLRLEQESVIYRFFLWLRGFITQKTTEAVYNQDILAGIAKEVNYSHAGLLYHKHHLLHSVFYDQLCRLKECADFFKPYFFLMEDNPGDFYVFLSSFVTPQLSEEINNKADPFILPFGQEPNPEIKADLMKKLDNILKNLDESVKDNLYAAISSVNWLKQFTKLPFIHFCAQFTNISGNSFTCPYKRAKNDFNLFAKVFGNVQSLGNDVLEAVFLYSQRKDLTKNAQTKDIEKASSEFLAKANGFLGSIEMFLNTVSICKIGKVVNEDYDWEPDLPDGVETWFPSFRSHWRKIIDMRWNEWNRERKKYHLTSNLYMDFNLKEFPLMKNRPWGGMWMEVPFRCELTGGFLCWFATEEFDEMLPVLNDVMIEGIFVRSENKTEYVDAMDHFVKANNRMNYLNGKLEQDGDFGAIFKEFAETKVKTLQAQKHIDDLIHSIEKEVREITKEFATGCRGIERVLHGVFDEQKDGLHESLQNLTTIKGRQNREWRDSLIKDRDTLKKVLYYISELEPIESSNND